MRYRLVTRPVPDWHERAGGDVCGVLRVRGHCLAPFPASPPSAPYTGGRGPLRVVYIMWHRLTTGWHFAFTIACNSKHFRGRRRVRHAADLRPRSRPSPPPASPPSAPYTGFIVSSWAIPVMPHCYSDEAGSCSSWTGGRRHVWRSAGMMSRLC